MRRFLLSHEHHSISSKDLLERCKETNEKPALANEYERIFSASHGLLSLDPESKQKQVYLEKRSAAIRTVRVKGLADDFYSSLLDWQGSNIIFALDERVFVQNFLTGRISLAARLNSTYITSVKASPDGKTVGVGTCTGDVAIIDLKTLHVTKRHQHKSRIGVLEWSGSRLLSGSRDRFIKYMDLKSPESFRPVIAHTQEVCGLSFSPDGTYLATGGNDNKVFILDGRAYSTTIHTITAHKAAVKAIGWSPVRANILATGGGTADRTVKTWKVSGSFEKLIDSIEYGSQVCNLHWTKTNELITTHGYSQNDIRIMDMCRKKQVKLFEGHRNRVIHFGMNEEEEYFATGSGDETLCVWRAKENNLSNFLVR
ncbi:cell division cycle 20-like protein 1, cofactor of APC complex [Nematocida sp. LUAm3]|nr:cell division cycle 20-like protein 1, cofactor of APC complex [Nematocida sp. LUAm3]KAI5175321.1 cell division cycle 20-like protein 1, cofactor of APC complex [Nematocida sp. LUAm2]KAI5177722.1 cell division cycle 20-like protein 1, cofactor of APC complex [Nematocida sp. LUAm1]